MNKKRNSLLVIVLLLLVGLTFGYVSSTYAKYTSKIEGNEGTVTVAKWAFRTDNPSKSLVINFKDTYDASTLVSGKIAPGTEGSFNIALSNKNSEVGVDWEIALKSITGKPTNLKFYKDAAHTTELTPGTSKITGQLAAKESTDLEVPIYWAWAYETAEIATNDPIDTQEGESPATLTIGVDITGTQVAPSTTAITSHTN